MNFSDDGWSTIRMAAGSCISINPAVGGYHEDVHGRVDMLKGGQREIFAMWITAGTTMGLYVGQVPERKS